MSDPKDPLPTFIRDDRKNAQALIESRWPDVIDGFQDVLTLGDAMMIQETYGLSVTFDEASLAWAATDPRARYRGHGNTPAAAIFVWDIARKNARD